MTSSPPVSPQAQKYNPRFLAGQWTVSLPGGAYAMGSQDVHDTNHDATPHMVHVEPLCVAIPPVTNAQSEDIFSIFRQNWTGSPRREHPFLCSFQIAQDYIEKVNQRYENGARSALLTEKQWEYVARGPAFGIRQYMGENGLNSLDDLRHHATTKGILIENIIPVDPVRNPAAALALGRDICANVFDPRLDHLMKGSPEPFGWFGRATLMGECTVDETVCDTRPVSLTKRVNRFGVSDMEAVSEWCDTAYDRDGYLRETRPSILIGKEDPRPRVIRGASHSLPPIAYTAAHRMNGSAYGRHLLSVAGFRVAVTPK